jgi:C4-dicarboxylate transporter DctM subunit
MSGPPAQEPVAVPPSGAAGRLDDALYALERVVAAVTMSVMVLVVFIDVVHRRLSASDSKIASLLSFGNRSLRAQLEGPATYAILLGVLFFVVRFAIVTLRRQAASGAPPDSRGTILPALVVTAAVSVALWLILEVPSRLYLGGLTLLVGAGLLWARRGTPDFGRAAGATAVAVALVEWVVWKYVPDGYTWSKEVSMILLVWNGLLGASMCSHDGKHIEFDFGPKALPPSVRPVAVAAGTLGQLFFTGFLASVSVVYVFGARGLLALGGTFEQTGIPDWTVGLACPVAFGVMSARVGGRLARQLEPLGVRGTIRVLAVAALVTAVLAAAAYAALAVTRGHESVGGWGWLPLGLGIVALLMLGEPLFVVMGGVVVACFLLWGDSIQKLGDFTILIERIRSLADTQSLLSVPFFILAGNLMSRGKLAGRLIEFARAAVGWLPGGLAIAATLSCVLFGSIVGSSAATLAAIGGLMVPALIKDRYREDFSIGLVTTVGSLGILVPPSIPMIIFCIFFTATPIEVERLFLAGLGPALFVSVTVGLYSMYIARREGLPRQRFSARALRVRFGEGFWALLMPFLILGGMYSGVFNAIEASAVAVVYSLIAEVYLERGMRWRDVPKVMAETSILLGSFIVVIVMAMALGEFLDTAGIPAAAASWVVEAHLSRELFLFALVMLLLVVGCLMDIMSAIMIFAPLTGPVALTLGIDPIHLGVIFIITLEVGYLTPPVGLNLFLSCTMFNKSFGYLIRATLPFVFVMMVAVFAVTYIPSISLAPVRAVYGSTQRGRPDSTEPAPPAPDDEDASRPDAGVPAKKQQGVQSIQEMMLEKEREQGAPDGGTP